MPRMTRQATVEILKAQGFDDTKLEGGKIYLKCSQCSAIIINGVACHETGCYNSKRKSEDAEE